MQQQQLAAANGVAVWLNIAVDERYLSLSTIAAEELVRQQRRRRRRWLCGRDGGDGGAATGAVVR